MGKHGRKLTAAFVRSVHEPGLYWDEHGLVLRVKPSGYKQWIQRLFIHGKRRELGLGPVRLVTLAEARDAALANRKVARAGGDPRATRRRSVPTFERAAAKVFAMHRTTWSAKHAAQWASTLRMYAHPRIGGKRVDRITSADVMGVLMPIWSAKHTTAKRVRERIGTVMKWTIAQGYRVDNPAGEAIRAALPKPGHVQKHLKALPYGEVAGAIEAIRRSGAGASVKLGLEFLALTACRSGEVRGARWGEIDVAGGVWTIPPERMKGRRGHRVPLAGEGAGDPRRGEGARAPVGVGVPVREGGAAASLALQRPVQGVGDRGRAARVPFELPRLGGGADGCAARGHGGGARACGPQPGGGGLRPLGPVRAPPCPDGAVGGVSGDAESEY